MVGVPPTLTGLDIPAAPLGEGTATGGGTATGSESGKSEAGSGGSGGSGGGSDEAPTRRGEEPDFATAEATGDPIPRGVKSSPSGSATAGLELVAGGEAGAASEDGCGSDGGGGAIRGGGGITIGSILPLTGADAVGLEFSFVLVVVGGAGEAIDIEARVISDAAGEEIGTPPLLILPAGESGALRPLTRCDEAEATGSSTPTSSPAAGGDDLTDASAAVGDAAVGIASGA